MDLTLETQEILWNTPQLKFYYTSISFFYSYVEDYVPIFERFLSFPHTVKILYQFGVNGET